MRKNYYFVFTLLFLSYLNHTQVNAQAVWTQKADFPSWRAGVSPFSIGMKGYFSCGVDNSFVAYNDLWEYDPATDVWTQKASLGGTARYSSSGFSIGNFGYVCLGWDINGNGLNDLWEYDPVLNVWTAKTNFPGTARYNAVAFVVDSKAYVGLGYKPVKGDIYEYDPTTNAWTALANAFPGGARTAAVAFSCTYTIAGTTYEKGFVTTGSFNPDANTLLANDLWEFTPGTTPGSGTWLAKSNLPGNGRYSSFAFSLNNRGYVGGGIGVGLAMYNDFYEYDPVADMWAVKDSFPGINCIHARGFAINNVGYAGTGQDLTTYYPYFYIYGIPTAINEISYSQFQMEIMPNPNNGNFKISLSGVEGKDLSLRIINPIGQTVIKRQEAISKGQFSMDINIGEVASGLYTVEIINGSKVYSNKFVVE